MQAFSSRARSTCSTHREWASACAARDWCTTGSNCASNGRGHRIDMHELTGGRAITVYAQHEVVKDLIQARLAYGGPICLRGGARVRIQGFDGDAPRIRFRQRRRRLRDRVRLHRAAAMAFTASAGLRFPPASCASTRRRIRSAGWGFWREAKPASDELIYANHERGFALLSMRTPQISRLYLQCRPDEDHRRLAGRAHLGRVTEALGDGARDFGSTKARFFRRA